METINIEYQGKNYPCVEVDFEDVYNDGTGLKTLVSVESLWRELEDKVDDGEEEATYIDNSIAFYLPDDFLGNNPTYEELVAEIKRWLV